VKASVAVNTQVVKQMEKKLLVSVIKDSLSIRTILPLVVLMSTNVMRVMDLQDYAVKVLYVPTSQELTIVAVHQDLPEIHSDIARTSTSAIDDLVLTDSAVKDQFVITLWVAISVLVHQDSREMRDQNVKTSTNVHKFTVQMANAVLLQFAPIPQEALVVDVHQVTQVTHSSVALLNISVMMITVVPEMLFVRAENATVHHQIMAMNANIHANNCFAVNMRNVSWMEVVIQYVFALRAMLATVTVYPVAQILMNVHNIHADKMQYVETHQDRTNASAQVVSEEIHTPNVRLKGKNKLHVQMITHVLQMKNAFLMEKRTNVSVDAVTDVIRSMNVAEM